jgi:hypothetical protein
MDDIGEDRLTTGGSIFDGMRGMVAARAKDGGRLEFMLQQAAWVVQIKG